MRLDEMRLAVHPGVGLVARFERTVLLVVGPGAGPAVADLIEACRSHQTAAERLRAIGPARKDGDPAFFAIVEEDDAVRSFVAGAMKVSIETDGSRLEFALTDRMGWMEETLRGRLRGVAVAEKAIRAGSQPFSDLVEGVVGGGGVELLDRGSAATLEPKTTKRPAPAPEPTAELEAPPAPPAQASEGHAAAAEPPTLDEITAGVDDGAAVPVPVPEPEPPPEPPPPPPATQEAGPVPEGFDHQSTMAVSAGPPSAPDAVTVEGRECANGHLNDPLAPACRVCGSPLLDAVSTGPRPPLGRLVAKDGLSFVVDRDFLIGRKPQEAPEVAAGVYAPLTVPPAETAASRVHAEIRISQWTVLLADRNSANGTFVRPAGVGDWIRLEPGHTVQVVPGSSIMIGNYELSFEW